MSDNGSGDVIRLLHTSDLHLGLGSTAQSIAEARRMLDAVGQMVRQEQVHLILIAGDLFDHNRVSEELSRIVAQGLGELAVPVVILPGNHDCLVPESVFRRCHFRAAGNIHVVEDCEDGTTVVFPDLDLAVWSRAHASYVDNVRPFAGIPPRGEERWQVAIGHGHIVRYPADEMRSYPIYLSELRSSDRDYIALGHWEIFTPVLEEAVFAYYSGAPQRTGHVNLVELHREKGVRVTRQALPI